MTATKDERRILKMSKEADPVNANANLTLRKKLNMAKKKQQAKKNNGKKGKAADRFASYACNNSGDPLTSYITSNRVTVSVSG